MAASQTNSLAWSITNVVNAKGFDLWFDDGNPIIGVSRLSGNQSSRLMVQNQGFLDVTMIVVGLWPNSTAILDFNGASCTVDGIPVANATHGGETVGDTQRIVLPFTLSFPGDGSFISTLDKTSLKRVDEVHGVSLPLSVRPSSGLVHGSFKSFPEIKPTDVKFLQDMIAQKYIPYQNIPDAPGKTDEEISALGARLFPWSPYSYELAMSMYDWTTASFTRFVFMKVFEYTSIPHAPFPLDESSIALMIWESNWGTYKPSDRDFMNSFMMQPANSMEDVAKQLRHVSSLLQEFSAVENRLLAAASLSLPRTSILAKPYLFSGQVDIFQMGIDRFGIEMLEFPGNAGPIGRELEVQLAVALSSFIEPGSNITTKMVWSFTDSMADAMHYSNGIVLIVEPPPESESFVWDATTYITALSDDDTKTEYLFSPGTRFRVLSVEQATVQDAPIQIIRLQVHPTDEASTETTEVKHKMKRAGSIRAGILPLHQVPFGEGPRINHAKARKTNGRRCQCVKGNA